VLSFKACKAEVLFPRSVSFPSSHRPFLLRKCPQGSPFPPFILPLSPPPLAQSVPFLFSGAAFREALFGQVERLEKVSGALKGKKCSCGSFFSIPPPPGGMKGFFFPLLSSFSLSTTKSLDPIASHFSMLASQAPPTG